jgi:hypothetical protein
MRTMTTLALAAGVSASVLGGIALQSAKAADMPVPQAQAPVPAPAYPPPAAESYAFPPQPPPVAYYAPPPPPVAYYAYPAPVVWNGPIVAQGPYWHGYAPRFAYSYGRWGYGWRR